MSDNFLPDEYQGIPQGESNYLKLEEGENIFRVLSNAVVGFEYWTGTDKERKPVRVKTMKEVPDEFLKNADNRQNAKYFWAFVVYNVKSESIQILELKQKTILRSIESLVKSKAWGDPKQYNIMITKTKTGSEDRDVEYSVMPEPKEELDKGVLKLYQDLNIDLNALYRGDDPFKSEDGSVDPNDIPDDLGN